MAKEPYLCPFLMHKQHLYNGGPTLNHLLNLFALTFRAAGSKRRSRFVDLSPSAWPGLVSLFNPSFIYQC